MSVQPMVYVRGAGSNVVMKFILLSLEIFEHFFDFF
jgi:hypothetical protein